MKSGAAFACVSLSTLSYIPAIRLFYYPIPKYQFLLSFSKATKTIIYKFVNKLLSIFCNFLGDGAYIEY
jgi:hypothetical protein